MSLFKRQNQDLMPVDIHGYASVLQPILMAMVDGLLDDKPPPTGFYFEREVFVDEGGEVKARVRVVSECVLTIVKKEQIKDASFDVMSSMNACAERCIAVLRSRL